MQKNITTWVCLRCKYEWIDKHKAEPRYCPRCGSCTIYVPKIRTIPKFVFSDQQSMKNKSILQFNQTDFQKRKEIEAVVR